MERYYYNQMNKIHQSVYHAMKNGLVEMAPSFYVPRLTGQELSEIFFKLRLDCPEIFYASGFSYRYQQEADNVCMIPEYLFQKGKIKEHQKAMKARVDRLIRPARSMSQKEQELYIHDFICSNVHYDKLKKPYSHEIIGPLGQGVGVCEGIAKTVKVLCDALGIWCMIAVSDANPKKKIKYRHAWNIVRIDGRYYHLDATFDNSLGHGQILRYDCYHLSDRQIFRDHEPVIYQTPPCEDGEHFYYREKKLSFTKFEEVEKRASQAVRKGKPFIFHWRGGYLSRESLTAIKSSLDRAAGKKGKYARVSVNWPQAVFCASFSDRILEEELLVEEPNEGEV